MGLLLFLEGPSCILFHQPNYLLSILENWLHKNWISRCDNNVRSKHCSWEEGGKEREKEREDKGNTKILLKKRERKNNVRKKGKDEDVKLNIM